MSCMVRVTDEIRDVLVAMKEDNNYKSISDMLEDLLSLGYIVDRPKKLNTTNYVSKLDIRNAKIEYYTKKLSKVINND